MNNLAQSSSESQSYSYWAFISYSHQDNLKVRGGGSADRIQWANWLHEQLETFRIPDGYRDRTTCTGEPMPERFFPTFRDEAELPTSHDLGGQIRDALARSRFLIVVASPRSASSRYVNEEVRHFRQLGRGNRILTLIVDGEPNVRLRPKAGWTAAHDCFCPALVHPLHDDGRVNESALLPEEPIAADVRVKEVEPSREMRSSERAMSSCHALLDFMKLKLIAGLMGVGLDELVQRDKQRAEEELRRVRRGASRTEFLFARHLLDLKDYPKAYARLSKALESDPDNPAATVLGLEVLRCRANRGLLWGFAHAGSVNSAVFSPDGSRILTASGDHTARLWDAASGRTLTAPCRHEGWVWSAEFSPDGKRILTASGDNTARLWDAASGRPLGDPMRHRGSVTSAVFSPDGTRIVTVSEDMTSRLWDAASGGPLTEPMRHDNVVLSALFSPDGARILTASGGGTARLWDAASGRPLAEPMRHENAVNRAVFSPDGTRILTSSLDNTARLWDAASAQPLAKPLQHESYVESAEFSPDGTRIVTASNDKTARLWDAASGRPLIESLRHEETVYFAVFSPDGTRIVTLSGKNAGLWDAASGQPLAEPFRHEDFVRAAEFSPDGTRILTASADSSARLWDASSGQPLATLFRNEYCVFSPDGKRIVSHWMNNARIWDSTSGQSLTELRHERFVRLSVFSPDGTRILTASDDFTARLWDAGSGVPLIEPLRHEGAVNSAVFSPDGTRILTVSYDKTARIWDAASGRPLTEPMRHDGSVKSATFSSDGTQFLTVSDSFPTIIRLWDAVSGRPLTEPLRYNINDTVLSAVFTPGGTRILTASGHDHTARLWDTASGRPLTEPLRHAGRVSSAEFSPDSMRILTASLDNTARLWDVASGQPLIEPLRHEEAAHSVHSQVRSAVFSPDGTRILSAADDMTARLWDAASGVPLIEPLRHEAAVYSAVFSPDGTRILTASHDMTTRLWDAADGLLTAEDVTRLRLLLEIAGSLQLNDRGLLEPVTPSRIEHLHRDFDAATELNQLLRWWWSDPFTRNINPSSTITVPVFVRNRISEVLDWPDAKVKASALKDARAAFPHHPLVLLCLAEQGKHGDPAWLVQHAVSRLLADTHYLTPLGLPRTDFEHAARKHELSSGIAEDCFLAARLLQRQERNEPAERCIEKSRLLSPENEMYRNFEL